TERRLPALPGLTIRSPRVVSCAGGRGLVRGSPRGGEGAYPAALSTVTSMTAPLLVPLGGRARCAVGPRGFPAGPPDGSPPAPLPAAPTRRRPPRGSRPRIERHRPEAPPPHPRFRRSPKPWSFRREPPPGELWTFFPLSGLFAYFWSFCSSRGIPFRSEEHTSELQSRENLVCRLLLEKKKRYPYRQ